MTFTPLTTEQVAALSQMGVAGRLMAEMLRKRRKADFRNLGSVTNAKLFGYMDYERHPVKLDESEDAAFMFMWNNIEHLAAAMYWENEVDCRAIESNSGYSSREKDEALCEANAALQAISESLAKGEENEE